MSNSISFVGHCCGDANVKNINGSTVLEVTVANRVGYGDKQITNWMRVSYWKNAEKMLEYCTKGKQVFVSGILTHNQYTLQNGTKNYQLLVKANTLELTGKKPDDAGNDTNPTYTTNTSEPSYDYDDIPF
jgi:single-strand DNA-binding protein